MAGFLVLVGALNIVVGLSVPLAALQKVRALHGLAESLSAVGGTAQVILGLMLAAAGIGLFWRLVSAWLLAIMLLLIAVGVNVARAQWGLSLGLQAVILIALILFKHRFTRRTLLANYLYAVSGIVAILAYGLFGSYLLGGGFRPPIRDLSTAFYYTIVTLGTVGYGDIVPVTPEARWFAVSLLVVGLGVFASAIASALGPKISGEITRLFNPKEKPMEPKNHVILVGDGVIAQNTVEELTQRNLPFVQIVSPGPRREAAGHRVVEGDATDDAVLEEAGIRHARLVIAAREDDGENAFIALGSKELNPNARVLAVASSAASIRRLKLA
ncbi:MAG: NAD-binding protein, partial [Opitutaceae bacterium]